MSDERKGKPSASGMSRLALCAGSWNLESTLPEQEPNQYMQLGTDVHAVLAGTKEFDELTPEGQDIATRCLSDYADMIAQLDLGERTKEIVEERFWYDDLYSGAIDRIDLFGDTAVVTDYKTGRTAQSKASENQQLKAYAVLVKKAFPEIKTILVAIIQPLAGGTTIAEYNEEELVAAEKEIVGIIHAAKNPNAPRTPNPDACKWCRAKSICPEVRATHNEIQLISGAVVNQLSNTELVAIDDKAEIVEDFIAEIRKEIKQRLMSGQQITGRLLGKGRITRVISDADSARMQLEPIMGIVPFLRSCKISITALEKEYASATGLKLKEAKAELEDKLGWLIDTKESEPSVIRDNK
jgi:CRISPR/Cas system-associated exonuclease Cas4 (RecB family)